MSTQKTPVRKKKKKYSPIKIFFKIVLSIVLVFCLAAGGAAFAYSKITGKPLLNEDDGDRKPNMVEALLKKGMKLNVAVFGVDGDGTRTDVMFVVHFDSKARTTNVISVPRDTRVSITSEIQDKLEEQGKYYQSPTKLNAVHSYSGKDMGCENAVLQIEDILGVDIDHYVKVDLVAFRKIVDTIGGVEVDVPQDMYYSDPYQDLFINLKAGPQTLDGNKAEQLVRFRKYVQGDVDRVSVQQLFLKALAKKVLSSESIIKNLPDYISVLYKDVKTDITLTDALKYVNYIKSIDTDKITMETLPGVGQNIGGGSYYIYDIEETRTMVDRLFLGMGGQEVASKDKNIEVSNGGSTQGLAGKFGQLLKQNGYQITGVSTYTGDDKEGYTRILVKNKGEGDDLKQYFSDGRVVVDDSLLSADVDIKIILGTDEEFTQ